MNEYSWGYLFHSLLAARENRRVKIIDQLSSNFLFFLTPVILILYVIFMDLYVSKDGDIDKVIDIVVWQLFCFQICELVLIWNDQYGEVIFVCGHLLFIDIFELLHIYGKNIGSCYLRYFCRFIYINNLIAHLALYSERVEHDSITSRDNKLVQR